MLMRNRMRIGWIVLAALLCLAVGWGCVSVGMNSEAKEAAPSTAAPAPTDDLQAQNSGISTRSSDASAAAPTGSVYESAYYGFGIDLGKLSFREKNAVLSGAFFRNATEEEVNALLMGGKSYQELYAEHTISSSLKETIEISIIGVGASSTAEEWRDYYFAQYSYYQSESKSQPNYYVVSKQTVDLCGKKWEAVDYYTRYSEGNSSKPAEYHRFMFYCDSYYSTMLYLYRSFDPDEDPANAAAQLDKIISAFYPIPAATPKSTPMPYTTPDPDPMLISAPSVKSSVAKTCGHYYHDAETEELLSQGEIGSVGYFYSNEGVQGISYYLIVKNNTEKAVQIRANATATIKDGTAVPCAFEGSVQYLDPGAVSYMEFPFYDIHDVVAVEHTIITSAPEERYQPCLFDLSMEVYENWIPTNVSVLLTNNGKYTEYDPVVWGVFLFFDEAGHLLTASPTDYNLFDGFADCDYEVKAGETVAASAGCAHGIDSYDHVSVYLYARRSIQTWPGIKTKQDVIGKDQLELHTYISSNNRSRAFLTVRNKASEDICVKVWGVLRDEVGGVLETKCGYTYALAPGQETILRFRFNTVEYCGEPEWIVSAGPFSDGWPEQQYDDILPWLKIDSAVEGRDVQVTVKYTHKLTADYATIFALFFDENDELIEYTIEDFFNKEEGINKWGFYHQFTPGASVTKTLTCSQDFARVELFAYGKVMQQWFRRSLG